MSNDYAPLPFSYLTGGLAPEKKPTGFKKSVSENEAEPAGQSSAPYSIYSGRTLERTGDNKSLRNTVVSIDVADPYLLSTGALNSDPEVVVGEPKNSYADDPRYRNSVPSESDGGNVFFRSPDGGDGPAQQSAPGSRDRDRIPQAGRDHVYLNQGFVSAGLDMSRSEEELTPGGAKKLPRFMVSDQGVCQYYSGTNGDVADGSRTKEKRPNGADSSSNPIWDKYYSTGGLDPGLQAKRSADAVTAAGIRPTTKADDYNTFMRSTSGPGPEDDDDQSCCCCCQTKKRAVLCAIFLTALICLAIGFLCGWFLYSEFIVAGTTDSVVGSMTPIPSSELSTTTTMKQAMTEMITTAIAINSTDSLMSNTTST